METELSGILWVKMVAENIVLGFSGTHFMHMRVNKIFKHKLLQRKLYVKTKHNKTEKNKFGIKISSFTVLFLSHANHPILNKYKTEIMRMTTKKKFFFHKERLLLQIDKFFLVQKFLNF